MRSHLSPNSDLQDIKVNSLEKPCHDNRSMIQSKLKQIPKEIVVTARKEKENFCGNLKVYMTVK